MKSIELLALAIKLLSIFLGYNMLKTAASVIPLLSGSAGFDQSSLYITLAFSGIVIIGFILTLILWNFPVAVSKWFMPTSSDDNYSELNFEVEALEVILYSAIGVYFVAQYFPDTIYNIFILLMQSNWDPSFTQFGVTFGQRVLDIAYSAFLVAIGVFLATSSGKLKIIISNFRKRIP